MPALAVTLDLAVLDNLGHDAVQVIRFDLQRLGDLGDRDSGLRADELEGLTGAGVATPAPTRPAGPTRAVTARARGRPWGSSRTAARADERGTCRLELADFLLELRQTAVNLLHRRVDEFCQRKPPPA